MSEKKKSLSDQAYDIIKDRIVRLIYEPGMPLTEVQLCEELGMSRNPIRTALKMLQTDGLIETDFHKSMKVKDISMEDVNEIYELREMLETAAFKKIFELGKNVEYSYRIEEKVIRMCANAGDAYEWEVADTHMHMEIIGIFQNKRINRVYRENLAESVRMGLYSVHGGMDIDATNENLKKMVAYMREGDYENAFGILRADHFMIGKRSAFESRVHKRE